MIKKCVICGEEFSTFKSVQKYCCRTCANKAYRERERNKDLYGQDEPPVSVKNCLYCGKEFATGSYSAHKKYCSSRCADRAYYERTISNTASHRARIEVQKVAKAEKKPVKPLSEWVKEAAECNIDYGTYRTLIEMQGKTFDELKATAPTRTPRTGR